VERWFATGKNIPYRVIRKAQSGGSQKINSSQQGYPALKFCFTTSHHYRPAI